jgi:aspartate kinase
MDLFVHDLCERGVDFMRIEEGEPEMPMIKNLLKAVIEKAGQKDIYITQGYICRNEYGEIDNPPWRKRLFSYYHRTAL